LKATDIMGNTEKHSEVSSLNPMEDGKRGGRKEERKKWKGLKRSHATGRGDLGDATGRNPNPLDEKGELMKEKKQAPKQKAYCQRRMKKESTVSKMFENGLGKGASITRNGKRGTYTQGAPTMSDTRPSVDVRKSREPNMKQKSTASFGEVKTRKPSNRRLASKVYNF